MVRGKKASTGFAGLASPVFALDTAQFGSLPTRIQPASPTVMHPEDALSHFKSTQVTPSAPPSGASSSADKRYVLGTLIVGIVTLGFHHLGLAQNLNSQLSSNAISQVPLHSKNTVQLPSLQPSPSFTEYETFDNYQGPRAAVRLVTDFDKRYRTRIRETQSEEVDFSGKYVVSIWGCGVSCLMGAIVNARNGKVIQLPSVCCWEDDGEQVIYRKDSRLLVLRGLIRERGGYGAHFYEMKEDALLHVKTILLASEHYGSAQSNVTDVSPTP